VDVQGEVARAREPLVVSRAEIDAVPRAFSRAATNVRSATRW
jgi:hypothetical protein